MKYIHSSHGITTELEIRNAVQDARDAIKAGDERYLKRFMLDIDDVISEVESLSGNMWNEAEQCGHLAIYIKNHDIVKVNGVCNWIFGLVHEGESLVPLTMENLTPWVREWYEDAEAVVLNLVD